MIAACLLLAVAPPVAGRPPGAIDRLGTPTLRHGSSVAAAAFSPDGQRLASGEKATAAAPTRPSRSGTWPPGRWSGACGTTRPASPGSPTGPRSRRPAGTAPSKRGTWPPAGRCSAPPATAGGRGRPVAGRRIVGLGRPWERGLAVGNQDRPPAARRRRGLESRVRPGRGGVHQRRQAAGVGHRPGGKRRGEPVQAAEGVVALSPDFHTAAHGGYTYSVVPRRTAIATGTDTDFL